MLANALHQAHKLIPRVSYTSVRRLQTAMAVRSPKLFLTRPIQHLEFDAVDDLTNLHFKTCHQPDVLYDWRFSPLAFVTNG